MNGHTYKIGDAVIVRKLGGMAFAGVVAGVGEDMIAVTCEDGARNFRVHVGRGGDWTAEPASEKPARAKPAKKPPAKVKARRRRA